MRFDSQHISPESSGTRNEVKYYDVVIIRRFAIFFYFCHFLYTSSRNVVLLFIFFCSIILKRNHEKEKSGMSWIICYATTDTHLQTVISFQESLSYW